MKKLIRRGISMLFALALCIGCSATAAEGDETRRVVRVGYPIGKGLCEVDENGVYSGYNYEYLQEIAQFTGWEYEFVQLPGGQNEVLGEMYRMLEAGELDLMCTTNYSAQLDEIYDFPDLHYGSVSATLEVLQENTKVNESNFREMPNLRIAVLEKAKRSTAALDKFCKDNNMTVTLVPCQGELALVDALRADRADLLLLNDAATIEGTRILARFNPSPFYFATTQGNTKLIGELNSAMSMLNDSDPLYTGALYEKYFARKRAATALTDEEKNYLATAPVLRVGVQTDRLPMEDCAADGSFRGISLDLLEILKHETGLRFELVAVPNMETLFAQMQDGTLDLSMGMTYDYNDAQNYRFSLTRPYMTAQIVMVVRDGTDPYELGGKRLALPRGVTYSGTYMGEIIQYDSIRDCLHAVNAGEADYCYGNGYSTEYYCNQEQYLGLTLVPQSSVINQYCIGVSRPANPLLLTVINKTIRNIPQGDLQSMIYRNSAPDGKGITFRAFLQNHPSETLVGVLTVALLLISLFAYIALSQRSARRRAQIESERYRMLSELSGEYLFEYSFETDRLSMGEKTVHAFGGKAVYEHFYRRVSTEKKENTAWILALFEQLKTEPSVVIERQMNTASGGKAWLRITFVTIKDQLGHLNSVVGKITDIQAEREELDALSMKARTDGLTGLYNATAAREMTEQALAAENGNAAGALMVMDIDGFKAINDSAGHYTGDAVLQGVARILRQIFREKDIIGRLGGDEFLVFLRGLSSVEVVEEKCRNIQAALERQTVDWPVTVTLSIGATMVSDGSDYDSLYQSADNALYAVKNSGRNHFCISGPSPAEK
ncbi:MAG: transporter substrate-binding domain-containing protein [Pseudoflavonifractor sp.]